MKSLKPIFAAAVLAAALAASAPAAIAQGADHSPETVMATYHVKPDQIDAFLKMMPAYWAALRARDMVLAEPHVLLRGDENGKPVVVEILSWREHGIPDNVPPAIQAYWDKMNAMVEARDGHHAIEFPEMTLVPLRP